LICYIHDKPEHRYWSKMYSMADYSSLDLLTVSATDFQGLMQEKQMTSADLVRQALAQIESHNRAGPKLDSMLSVVPRKVLLDTTAKLDAERAEGKTHCPLHGIPIIVKVCDPSTDVSRANLEARTALTHIPVWNWERQLGTSPSLTRMEVEVLLSLIRYK
jgi:hypothetical protein